MMKKRLRSYSSFVLLFATFSNILLYILWVFLADRGRTGKLEHANDRDFLYKLLLDSIALDKKLDSSGEYVIIQHVERIWLPDGKKNDTFGNSSLSLVTQCSVNHLHRLVKIGQFWDGPISLAVFIHPEHVHIAIDFIVGIYHCHSFLHHRSQLEIFQNYDWGSFDYPTNLMRNVALSASQSKYIFVIDIDMMTNHGLYEQFEEMIKSRSPQSMLLQKFAYVIPAYETFSERLTLFNKSHLVDLVGKKLARPFYTLLCNKCQDATDHEKWIKLKISSDLNGAYEISWKPPWEPFYIVPYDAPMYNEQFRQYGFNRVSHACEMHMLGYRFIILNNAFLLHNGFKEKQSFHAKKKYDELQNRLKYYQFLKHLSRKYPQSQVKC